eukprot:scaffold30967_cov102-Isochrysis_galbana.AAC.1
MLNPNPRAATSGTQATAERFLNVYGAAESNKTRRRARVFPPPSRRHRCPAHILEKTLSASLCARRLPQLAVHGIVRLTSAQGAAAAASRQGQLSPGPLSGVLGR